MDSSDGMLKTASVSASENKRKRLKKPRRLFLVRSQDFFNLNFEVVQIRSEVFQVANRINLTAKLKNAYSLDLI